VTSDQAESPRPPSTGTALGMGWPVLSVGLFCGEPHLTNPYPLRTLSGYCTLGRDPLRPRSSLGNLAHRSKPPRWRSWAAITPPLPRAGVDHSTCRSRCFPPSGDCSPGLNDTEAPKTPGQERRRVHHPALYERYRPKVVDISTFKSLYQGDPSYPIMRTHPGSRMTPQETSHLP
jgi:hypothetical protein